MWLYSQKKRQITLLEGDAENEIDNIFNLKNSMLFGALRIDIKFPRIRLARLKFELTNQDSAGGKNCNVVTSDACIELRLGNISTADGVSDCIDYEQSPFFLSPSNKTR